MELGATVCSPKNPACDNCPIKDMCYAKNMNATDELPVKQKRHPSHTTPLWLASSNDLMENY